MGEPNKSTLHLEPVSSDSWRESNINTQTLPPPPAKKKTKLGRVFQNLTHGLQVRSSSDPQLQTELVYCELKMKIFSPPLFKEILLQGHESHYPFYWKQMDLSVVRRG